MQACARVRSRVSDQGHCKVRLEEGQRLGCRARVEAVCQVRSAELTGQCRSRTAPGSPCPAMEGGRSEATSTSMLLRCAVCCSRHGHGERYHERAFLAAIITSEPRVDTLDCTPGATKALADAAARTTRRAVVRGKLSLAREKERPTIRGTFALSFNLEPAPGLTADTFMRRATPRRRRSC